MTLPLNQGDIILIHSVHTNGWADGTLLDSGHRGWLPTNFCEGYEPEPLRNLLMALTHFWDIVKACGEHNFNPFSNQDYTRGLIAGVRNLLVDAGCLNREDALISTETGNNELRRARKVLLSELSGFIKLTKGVEIKVRSGQVQEVVEDDGLEHMVMAAFRIIVRAVRFHDVWAEEAPGGTLFIEGDLTINTFSSIPPTPPADNGSFRATADSNPRVLTPHQTPEVESAHHPSPRRPAISLAAESRDEQTSTTPPSGQDRSSLSLVQPPRSTSTQTARPSASHRVSWTAQRAYNGRLASERLHAAHDAFLRVLTSFIGPHLFSRSSTEILVATQQSVNTGRVLLQVVEGVWDRGYCKSEQLTETRDNMYAKIMDMVQAAQSIFQPTSDLEEEEYNPDNRQRLADAATRCMRGAGECVATTRYVLEMIGDFEFETLSEVSPFIDFHPDSFREEQEYTDGSDASDTTTTSSATPLGSQSLSRIDTDIRASSEISVSDDATLFSNRASANSLLPPVPSLTSSISSQGDYSPLSLKSNNNSMDFHARHAFEPRSDSLGPASTATSSTCISSFRGSERSVPSTSTTPDILPDMPATPIWKDLPTLGLSNSLSSLDQEADEGEKTILGKTYAHEIMVNKDGQITGGTLPALIERLTTHDSTPDAVFVTTFYLTFRIFTTPTSFARALVDRFDYVAHSQHISGPVQLRVYNIFKGWLESHWRMECDGPALEIIVPFASTRLLDSLPAAGKRLLDLTNRVTESTSPLFPRLVSSVGKTNTAVAQHVAPDTPLPAPIITSKQISMLKNHKNAGPAPTILDFDPQELARQLTLKASAIFCLILPEELLGTEWTKKTGSIASNVKASSRLSTDLTNWVKASIVDSSDQGKRAKTIKQWVKVAMKCYELQNFDSLMAIICALDNSAIVRLKRTWECVSTRTKASLEKLKPLVNHDRNYTVLRQTLANCMPSCLPFVGLYLTDLTFVDAGNQATRLLPNSSQNSPTSIINFDKHVKTAKIISELQRFQIPYRLQEVEALQNWLQEQMVESRTNDDAKQPCPHYRRSCILEPKEAQAGKPAVDFVPLPDNRLTRNPKSETNLLGGFWRSQPS